MDKYDIKGTFLISTEQDPPPEERFHNQLQVWLLWPRMQKAVENGHELGAHAVTHPCHRPQSDRTSENYRAFCDANYNDAELKGSRDMILKKHVAALRVDLGRIPAVTARTSTSSTSGSPRPATSSRATIPARRRASTSAPICRPGPTNPYDAPYTQVVQKAGGRRGAPAPAIDVPDLDTKFDEVYQKGRHLPLPVAPAVARLRSRRVLRKAPVAHRPPRRCVVRADGPGVRVPHDRREDGSASPMSKGERQGALRGLEHARPQDLQREPHARVHRAGIRLA